MTWAFRQRLQQADWVKVVVSWKSLGIENRDRSFPFKDVASPTSIHRTVSPNTVFEVAWSRINRTIPGSLVGLVLAIAIASYFHLKVPTIRAIPQSLPMLQGIPLWNDFGFLREPIDPALALAALGSIESLLSANLLTFAYPHLPEVWF